MLRHQLLLIYRNCQRFRSTFFINFIGLSTGLTCVILILLWVKDELDMDKFHEKGSQLYQVLSVHNFNSELVTAKATTGMLEQTLVQEVPEIEQLAVLVNHGSRVAVSVDEKVVKAQGKFGSRDFFKVFSFPLVTGDIDQVLMNKDAIAISRDLAMRLYNTTEDLIGKTVQVAYDEEYSISGVFENVPQSSSLQFDFIQSFEALKAKYPESFGNWGNTGPRTFIVLKPETKLDQFQAKFKDFVISKNPDANTTLLIQPFSETYLFGKYRNGKIEAGRMVYVKLFSVIALFILVIACINFMNLSTANSSRRTKEVGIKKTLGSSRKALIFQHLGESVLMAFVSFFVALIFVFLILPHFNHITGKQISFNVEPVLVLFFIGIVLLTGLLAGSYPALFLSGFQPIVILKGKLKSTFGEILTRKGLVLFQFILSVILIVSVIVVYKQIQFIQSEALGYDKTNVVYFPAEGKIKENKEVFLAELKKIPGVINAAITEHHFMGHEHRTGGVLWEGKNEQENITFEYGMISQGLIETLGMEMVEGRSFSQEYGDEKSKIIFNETAIKAMGLDNPIGAVVKQWGEDKQIIGVVKDFHFESFHEQIKPMFFAFDPVASDEIMARILPGKEQETIQELEATFNEFNPDFIFEYNFLDHSYQSLYKSEQVISTLTRYFSGLTVLISCLGLFGLAQFTAARRVKEIGIRKILGASVPDIIKLLSQDFTQIVTVAIVIAIPISYVFTSTWLETFAFRITLSWYFFAGAGMVALGIAWSTIALQTFKAANVNPTECVKDE